MLVTAAALTLAAAAFLTAPGGWGWLAAGGVLCVGFLLAERVFRRLAARGTIRADLEDRVRHPPP